MKSATLAEILNEAVSLRANAFEKALNTFPAIGK